MGKIKLPEIEFYREDFLLHCESKNLSEKTLKLYIQSLKLFLVYLWRKHKIEDLEKVKPAHIRQYVMYVQERGKYTIVGNEKSRKFNNPDGRTELENSFTISKLEK
ncbi:phage integrase N-terminal SAM-like domain-containing protein [Sporosarcina sp. NPDC096371]|uniref:phage integrase N-terminal SAM-like domain-containing protein n=1 Tax=Sporosarcina sp. NPDC096371 TaxID=3364530 RepID=UPI0038277416